MGAKWFYYFQLYNFVFDLQIYMTAPNILIFLLTAATNNYLIFLNILAFIFIPQSGVTTSESNTLRIKHKFEEGENLYCYRCYLFEEFIITLDCFGHMCHFIILLTHFALTVILNP